jgi:hypothetical protein
MMIEVFEAVGEPSDLQIYSDPDAGIVDLTLRGSLRILQWLNRGYRRILCWKFADGRQVRFPAMEGKAHFKTTVLTGNVTGAASDGADQAYVEISGGGGTDGLYEGWILEITAGTGSGQKRRVTQYVGATRRAYINKDWSTQPEGPTGTDPSSYSMYKDFVRLCRASDSEAADNVILDPESTALAVLKIVDVRDGEEIVPAERTEAFPENVIETGTPSEYYRRENDIVFDVAVSDERWYSIEYVKMPAAMSTLSESPRIPEVFHDAIVLYAHYLGLRRGQEWSGAYSTKRDLTELMAGIKDQVEVSFERETAYVTPL